MRIVIHIYPQDEIWRIRLAENYHIVFEEVSTYLNSIEMREALSEWLAGAPMGMRMGISLRAPSVLQLFDEIGIEGGHFTTST